MTQTYTTTETWSRTHARYVAGKVAADLRQMQQEYGQPSDTSIDAYLNELTILLIDGYVKEVSYGYRLGDAWVAALKYTADMYGNLNTDDRSGRIPRGANISGAAFHSFLEFSPKWYNLPANQREAIERTLPFIRTLGIAPIIRVGGWASDKSYASAGCGLHRATVGGAW